jgi:hypothetical protein
MGVNEHKICWDFKGICPDFSRDPFFVLSNDASTPTSTPKAITHK